jgi:predicted RNA binding protein YcfA (HicA-like mRNA interferase family)
MATDKVCAQCVFVRILLAHQSQVCIKTHVDIRRIEAAGWRQVRQSGSHKQFRPPTLPGLVTVPSPKKDSPFGTLRSIARLAGIDLE